MAQSRDTTKRPDANGSGNGKPPQRQRTRVDDVRALVQTNPRVRTAVEQLLAKRTDFDRFARVFLNVVEGNVDLIQCTDGSLARAFMHSAELNLQVGSAYPHAYLIPYWNKDARKPDGTLGAYEAQLQVSVWGYTELARRSGQVRKIWADVICENDPFECVSGTEGKIVKHNPNWFAPRAERGAIIGSYACALLDNGETVFEPVSREELDQARKSNRGKTPAWDLWPEEQCKKVAIKRLCKYLPKGDGLARAIELDNDPGSSAIDVEGVPVDPTSDPPTTQAQSTATNAPLDQVVANARAAEAAAGGEPKMNTDQLFAVLCDVDERWKTKRTVVEGWDDFESLAAFAFCKALLRDVNGTGEPPDMPPHMRIFRDDPGSEDEAAAFAASGQRANDVSGGVIR